MSIYEAIKEEEEQLKKEMGEELQEEVPEEVEDVPEEKDEEPKDEIKEESKEETLTPTDFYRMRQKNKLLESRLDSALANQQAPQKAEVESQQGFNKPEPDKAENYEAWLEWRNEKLEYQINHLGEKFETVSKKIEQEEQAERQRRLYEGAANEISQYEAEYRKVVPDYDTVTQNAYQNLLSAYETIGIPRQEAAGHIAKQVLDISAAAYRKGISPAEAIYDYCVERFGRPVQKEEKPAANLKKIEETKRRSATGLSSGGQSGSPTLTIDAAAELSLGEFAKLDSATLRRLERGG